MVALGKGVSQPACEKSLSAKSHEKRLSQTLATGDRRKAEKEAGGLGGDARERKRPQRGKIRTLPCAGIIQIRFKGYFSPATHGQSGDGLRCAAQDPRVSSRHNTPRRSVLATICNTHACVCIAYCIMTTTVFSRIGSSNFDPISPANSRRLLPAFQAGIELRHVVARPLFLLPTCCPALPVLPRRSSGMRAVLRFPWFWAKRNRRLSACPSGRLTLQSSSSRGNECLHRCRRVRRILICHHRSSCLRSPNPRLTCCRFRRQQPARHCHLWRRRTFCRA